MSYNLTAFTSTSSNSAYVATKAVYDASYSIGETHNPEVLNFESPYCMWNFPVKIKRIISFITSKEGRKLNPDKESPALTRLLDSHNSSLNPLDFNMERFCTGLVLFTILGSKEGFLKQRFGFNDSLHKYSHSSIFLISPEKWLHPTYHADFIRFLQSYSEISFFLTTTSPYMLKEIPPECVKVYYEKTSGTIDFYTPRQTMGLDVNLISQGILQTPTLKKEIYDEFQRIDSLISEGKYEEATHAIKPLEILLNGSVPETTRMKSLIQMFKD